MSDSDLVQRVEYNGKLIAIIIRAGYKESGIKFFTPKEFSQQLAYMHRRKGELIPPHIHNLIWREIVYTQEVLIIKKGRVKVNLFSPDKKYIASNILNQGDTILLANGGHGFEMLEDSEIIEIKQGPYTGKGDKRHFEVKDDTGK